MSDSPGAKRAARMYTHSYQVLLATRRASGRSTPWGWISSCTCLGRRCGPGSRRSRGRSGVGAHRAGTRCRPCGSARTRWKPWAGRASRQRSRGGASAAAGGRGGRRGTVRKAQAWAARDRGGDGKPVHTQHDTAKGLRQTSPRGFARTTALEGVPCAGAGSTQTSGSRSAARAGRARRRARRETVGAARPGNRRAQKAKAIGEGAERESWSDAGGRWHRGGGAEEARGL